MSFQLLTNTSRNSKTSWLLILPDLSPKIHVLSVGPFEEQSNLSQAIKPKSSSRVDVDRHGYRSFTVIVYKLSNL